MIRGNSSEVMHVKVDEYPYLKEVMTTVGPDEIYTYALRLQNITTQYIATHTILEICLLK